MWTTICPPRHRDNLGRGCATAALASDARRQSGKGRTVISDAVASQIARFTDALSTHDGAEDARREAIGTWSAMVGALILARSVEGEALSDEILTSTKDWIRQGRSQG